MPSLYDPYCGRVSLYPPFQTEKAYENSALPHTGGVDREVMYPNRQINQHPVVRRECGDSAARGAAGWTVQVSTSFGEG